MSAPRHRRSGRGETETIWIDAGTYTLLSGSGGGPQRHHLAMQDWGLQATKIVYAIEFINRRSANVQVEAQHWQAPTTDRDLAKEHSVPIAPTTVDMDIPAFLQGVAVGTTTALLPFFWPTIEVDAASGSDQEWVTFRLWLGGSPF